VLLPPLTSMVIFSIRHPAPLPIVIAIVLMAWTIILWDGTPTISSVGGVEAWYDDASDLDLDTLLRECL